MKILIRSHYNVIKTNCYSYGEILFKDRWLHEDWLSNIFGIDDYGNIEDNIVLQMIDDEDFVFNIKSIFRDYIRWK